MVAAIGPEDAASFQRYWDKNDLPFTGLPDPTQSVLKKFGQEFNLLKLGRQPALMIVDRQGMLRYVHYAKNQSDIPSNREVLSLLDELERENRDEGGLKT